jgi:hypothetical protein
MKSKIVIEGEKNNLERKKGGSDWRGDDESHGVTGRELS